VQPAKKKHRRRAKKKGVKQNDPPQQPENDEGRKDSKIGSGDNRGDTEMRDVEKRTRTKTRENEGVEHRADRMRATYPTDETTEKCERAEWRKRSCKSLL
jgi:hypothetical protein